jgi:uncharacterized repeat protein (TIGR01451 family)
MKGESGTCFRFTRMVHIVFVGITALFILLVIAAPGLSGRNPSAMVAVHVMPHDDSRACGVNFPTIDEPADIAYTYVGLGGVDIFPVFYELTEYRVVTYGLTWSGSSSCIFTSCSDLNIGDIVWPGDGMAHNWSNCQAGPTAIPGFGRIEVSGPGHVCVVPWTTNGYVMLEVLDCEEGQDEPVENYCAGVGGATGDEPCWGYPGPLRLYKSEDACSDCAEPGDTLIYTLTYENLYGPSALDVSVIDHLPPETEYLSSSPPGTYQAEGHTVTWYVGEVPVGTGGSVELRARLKPDSPATGAVLNMCEIRDNVITEYAAWDSTRICASAIVPTTWGKVKSLFR